jgi:twitching motility protein PilT
MADSVSPAVEQVHAPAPGSSSEHVHTLEHVDHYLRIGQESGASDIHLGVNALPIWRRFGSLEPIWLQADRLSAADTERLAMGFLDDHQKQILNEHGDVDFAYATQFGRFRASVVRHRLGLDLVFRIISSNVRTMDELGLPQSLKLLTQYHNGLVLVTGSVGSVSQPRWRRSSRKSTARGTTTSSRSRILSSM